jgi:Erythromycin esterase homolog
MNKTTLFLFFFLIPFVLSSQTIEEKYDLCFNSGEIRWNYDWIISADNCSYSLDSLTSFNGKHPLRISPASKLPFMGLEVSEENRENRMNFILGKEIVLPDNKGKFPVEVNLTCLSYADSLLMQVVALDENENVVSSDSLFILHGDDWDTYSIRINNPNVQAFKLLLKLNELKKPGMRIYLDRFQIKMGDIDINSLPVESLNTPYSFDPSFRVELNDSLSYAHIPELKNKKLIGIGECTHGSQEIKETAYELMKYLIKREGVRYVFLESASRTMGMYFDLYAKGLIPGDKAEDIVDILKCRFDNYKETVQFLQFLRTYNQSAEEKVSVFGMDLDMDGEEIFIAHYFLNLLGSENAKFYINHLSHIDRYNMIIDYLKTDGNVRSKLTKAEIEYLVYVLEERLNNSSLLIGDLFDDRDHRILFSTVDAVVNHFFDSSSKGVIFAHSLHINKVWLRDFESGKKSLGYYLSTKFQDNYYNLTLQIGEGTYLQDESIMGSSLIIDSLQEPPPRSMENICLKVNSDRFFYPSDKFPSSALTWRSISRSYKDRYQFILGFKKRFDGIIFIRDSHSLHEYQDLYVINDMEYLNKKARELNDLLKYYRNKQ